MDGFSYNNIFETKGIEYLIIIAFLLLIIPFWVFINKKTAIKDQIRKTLGVLTSSVLRIPQGIFYSKNHTWTYLEKSGYASVGLDDLLLHITGDVKFLSRLIPDGNLHKGELLAEIESKGKILQVFSPISGRVVKVNQLLSSNPELLNEDPYGKGWVCMIKPSDWVNETSSYFLAENAAGWFNNELNRFRDFLAASLHKYSDKVPLVALQDGGELCDKPLSELPAEVWHDFQKSFLN